MKIERCTDESCKGYGKELVDRGYGYPVCQTNRRPLGNVKPMGPQYEGQYNTEPTNDM